MTTVEEKLSKCLQSIQFIMMHQPIIMLSYTLIVNKLTFKVKLTTVLQCDLNIWRFINFVENLGFPSCQIRFPVCIYKQIPYHDMEGCIFLLETNC